MVSKMAGCLYAALPMESKIYLKIKCKYRYGKSFNRFSSFLEYRRIDTTLHYAMVKKSNVKSAHKKFIG